MTTLRIIMDAAVPTEWPFEADGFMVYAGGANADHAWTDAEIREGATRMDEALPIWVYGLGQDGREDGQAFQAWLDAHSVSPNALVLLDMETAVDAPYVENFDAQIRQPLALYGSTGTLFGNPDIDGWWPADPTGQPHLFVHRDVKGTQYAWFGLQQTKGPYDLSLASPDVVLWQVRRWRPELTSGRESLIGLAEANGTHAATVLRVAARRSPSRGYEPALANYLNHGDLTAKLPAGITLWLPE